MPSVSSWTALKDLPGGTVLEPPSKVSHSASGFPPSPQAWPAFTASSAVWSPSIRMIVTPGVLISSSW